MLHVLIDAVSGVPAYRQIMDQFLHYIASGALPPGAQLPSIRELARTLRVNPTTIVKAYTELEHQGTITMQQGKGAFVATRAAPTPPAARERLLRPLAHKLAVEARQLGLDDAVALRLLREELDGLEGARP